MIAIEPLDGASVGAELLHEANLAMNLELVFVAWVVFRTPAPRAILDELCVSIGSAVCYPASGIKGL